VELHDGMNYFARDDYDTMLHHQPIAENLTAENPRSDGVPDQGNNAIRRDLGNREKQDDSREGPEHDLKRDVP